MRHAIGIGAVAGQHDAISIRHDLRVVSDHDGTCDARLGEGALQRLGG